MIVETESELGAVTRRLPASKGGCAVVDAPPRRASARRVALSTAVGGPIPALPLDHSRLVEELRASRLRVVQAAERERRRLEQDLHDGAQQRLVEIQVRLSSARALVDRADLASELDAIQEAAEAALDELRTLARGIYPSTLQDHGPAAALRALAQRSAVPIRVIDEGIGRAPAAAEAAIYFCAREAIQNATKHAGPGAIVTATLTRRRGAIHLTISDNGVGISPNAVSNGIGIRGMHDRIEAVGGRLDIFSEPGLGTCIRGTIPHEEAPLANVRADTSSEAGVALAC
ncbi:MAG TPA: ATP-binding protein [Solirubrobacteraceae bacterium]